MKQATKTVADYSAIPAPTRMWTGRGSDFYRITPVKGARIDGTVLVGMSSHEATTDYGSSGLPQKTHAPAMWVDLSPIHVDNYGGASSEREPLTINGKTYDARFGARVELVPAERNDWRDEHYRRVTVGDRDYFLTSRVDSWDGLSDSARAAVYAVIEAIAAEYVTNERWHDQQVKEAEYAVKRATDKRDEAQGVLDMAVADLAKLAAQEVSA